MTPETKRIFENIANEKYPLLSDDRKGLHNESVTAFTNVIIKEKQQVYIQACTDWFDIAVKHLQWLAENDAELTQNDSLYVRVNGMTEYMTIKQSLNHFIQNIYEK